MSEEDDKRPTRGLFDFSDGGRYQGEWFCGGAHGYGVCSLPGDGGSSFEGYWEEGSQKSGVFTWSSGHKYIGTWQDGMRHGLGKEVSWYNDSIYMYSISSLCTCTCACFVTQESVHVPVS